MIRSRPTRIPARLLALALLPAAGVAWAQDSGNVRVDYARVLNVEPVYETMRATRTERVCDQPEPDKAATKAEDGRFVRMWDSVKGLFGSDDGKARATEPEPGPPRCRTVLVGKQYQRPVAYDVDYMYKGMKYRSRLAEDPGTRLRIRISVAPYESTALP